MANRLKAIAVVLLAVLLLAGCSLAGDKPILDMSAAGRFEDLVYNRPDPEDMEQAVDELEEALGRLCLPSTLTGLIQDCYDCYYSYSTMSTLADIRNCQDLSDEFYSEEYAWCLENMPRMQQLVEEMYTLCAQSMYAPLLEHFFFWDGFVMEYRLEGDSSQPEELYELYRQENQLINQYRSLIADPVIELGGQSLSLEEYLLTAGEDQIYEALWAYYEQYNPRLGELYLQLIRLRQQQAELSGFDSYEQMQYSLAFERDYSPEEAAEYLREIKECLGPYYAEVMAEQPYSLISWDYMSDDRLLETIAQAAEKMGGDIDESFRFMQAYGLCDVELRPYKAAMSFQTYLDDYGYPFLFLDPYGDQSDVLSFAHEFGHFTDAYINYNAYETTDLAECFSQAMEYLILFYLGDAMEEGAKEELLFYKALDTLELYVGQAAIAEFESRACSLPPEELTVDELNRLYMEISAEYGLCDGSSPEQGWGWIDITHLFESPFYVISYPVTNDVAMQIFALEQEQAGSGLEKFLAMLPRQYDSLMPTLEEAGLDSPFDQGRISQVRSNLERVLSR